MCLTRFLFDRIREELDRAKCAYKIEPQGRITCLWENPTEDNVAALSRWDLVRWCERQPGAQPVLAMLADHYAHHPDHRLEWHNLQQGQTSISVEGHYASRQTEAPPPGIGPGGETDG
jgi:hypothetical protein